MSDTLELAVITAQSAVEIFSGGGLSALLGDVEKKVRAIPLDASTVTGREQIRSVAYKVTRTKTALDLEAKKLTEKWREATSKVNADRKVAQERLDALAEEVRAPLTAFENKEKSRIAAHEAAIGEISGLAEMVRKYPDMPADLIEDHGSDLAALHAGRVWEEFSERAARTRSEVSDYVSGRLAARRKFDADQAELARLRAEEVERQTREREERIKSEAAENARIQAERKAKEAADAEARRVIEAARAEEARVKAETDRVRLEHERAQRQAEEARLQEERARQSAERKAAEAESARLESIRRSEADKKAAEEKAAADLKAAQEKSKRDANAAVAKERERAERQRRAEEDARVKREADEKLRTTIRSEIKVDLLQAGEGGTDIADAILDGKIRHVRVIW